jgi:hypothetical protein
MMKNVYDLQISDTLYRQVPIKEECQIKDITSNRHAQKVFDFGGFIVDQPVMSKMFKCSDRGNFEVKDVS